MIIPILCDNHRHTVKAIHLYDMPKILKRIHGTLHVLLDRAPPDRTRSDNCWRNDHGRNRHIYGRNLIEYAEILFEEFQLKAGKDQQVFTGVLKNPVKPDLSVTSIHFKNIVRLAGLFPARLPALVWPTAVYRSHSQYLLNVRPDWYSVKLTELKLPDVPAIFPIVENLYPTEK